MRRVHRRRLPPVSPPDPSSSDEPPDEPPVIDKLQGRKRGRNPLLLLLSALQR
jgi:hypothetical protein